PFFLYIPFNAPHTPFQVPRSYYDRYANIHDHNKRVYAGMIAAFDDAVGDILKTLRDEGLDENTLVFFASDNGGATYTEATDNAPLAGGKFTLFEGGINIPLFFRWKGKVAPAHVDKMVALPDVFTTSLAAAGIPLPQDRIYDGVNLLAHLASETKAAHEVLFWRSLDQKAVRKENWKLFVDTMGGRKRLYDLANDKGEAHDLGASHPKKIKELEALLENWERPLKPPLWPHVMDYRVRVGNESFMFSL
ncbi:MAG: sulfatase-like hydrolase/transferase, partial [Spirochaetia bacterium]|nr:sulfatase-like hydrolase/transferase [Spirochaetia bacterium]